MLKFIQFIFFSIVLLFTLATTSLNAQNGCDGNRYINKVFPNVTVTADVIYGNNTTLGGVNTDLKMDIYEPVGDPLQQRPLIVVAHGGSFITGNKSDIAQLCEDYAKRGYVVASIQYRLIDALVFDSVTASEGVVMAVGDMKAAIRYFREDAANNNLYKINPNMVFAGGGSAGAIIALHTGVMNSSDAIPAYIQNHIDNNGGPDGNSSANTNYSNEVNGIISYSGSLLRADWVDVNSPPIYLAHEELDPVVPCGYGTSSNLFFPFFAYGSCSINNVADQVGTYHDFYFVSGSSSHVDYLLADSMEYELVVGKTMTFLEPIVCGTVGSEEYNFPNNLEIYPNPNNGNFFINTSSIQHQATLFVFDSSGRMVVNKEINSLGFVTSQSLNLSAGLYHVILRNDLIELNQKLLIQ